MDKEKDLNGTEVKGGGMSQKPEVVNKDKSLWWLAGFILALTLLAVILAII